MVDRNKGYKHPVHALPCRLQTLVTGPDKDIVHSFDEHLRAYGPMRIRPT